MDEIKLRTYDGVVVTGFLMLPALFTTGLSHLAGQTATAGWLSLLIAFAVMACLFLLTACLMKRFPGKSIIQISADAWKPLGSICGAVFGAYFCFFTGINIREGAEILKIYGLGLTPLYVVAGLIVLACVIMNLFGGHAIVKSAGFFFIIIALGIVSAMLLGINRYNPDNLVPVLGNGLPAIAVNGLYATSLFDGVAALFLFAPAFKSAGKMIKSGLISLSLAAAAYVALFMCFVMMFSAPVAAEMMSGFIEIGKSSYYNHFFSRFESMLLFYLIFSSAIQASIGLYIARTSLAWAFKVKVPRVLAVVCGVFTALVALIPKNVLDLTQVYLPVIRQYGVLVMAGFPLLLLAICAAKRRIAHEES